MCRSLGDVWVLQADYGTVCYTSDWYVLAGVCGTLAVLWPIGIPAVLFFKIRHAVPLIQQGDEDTIKFWSFAIGVRTQRRKNFRRATRYWLTLGLLSIAQDYDRDHWYWEVRVPKAWIFCTCHSSSLSSSHLSCHTLRLV